MWSGSGMIQVLPLAQTLASFGLVLGILVSIHELGHYLAARWCGIGVEAFSLGFGPALKSWVDKRGTVWKISALPLGGYVKMYGMSPTARQDAAEAGEEFRALEAYSEKHVGKRAIVAFAGPLANFLLAIFLFSALLMTIGRQVPLPTVGQVVENSAAAAAGLKVGDDITAVDGMKVTRFTELRDIIAADPDRDVTLSVTRGTTPLTLKVHVATATGATGTVGRLGVVSGKSIYEKVGPLAALEGGVTQTWDLLRQTLIGLVNIVTSGQGADELGGPIMIAHMSGQVAQLGLPSLLTFIALLSVNLGLVNLLPIPVLDGGHLMFYAAEAVRGRPVPARAQEYGYRVGIALIACVFVFASWNDLVREGALRWVTHLRG
jgi:regulator of sigma E protease